MRILSTKPPRPGTGCSMNGLSVVGESGVERDLEVFPERDYPSSAMKFTKMHGIGNDYVYVNGFDQKVENPAEVARKVADRHFGIGGDGLILILPSDKADVRMRMFNADGSEGEMCGNGIRCVAKFAYDRGLSKNNPMKVETGRGVLTLELCVKNNKVEEVTV